MIKDSVYTAAVKYLCEKQWSILPLQGSGHDGKRPLRGIQWAKYRRQAAKLGEVRTWFKDHTISAIGIICGMVSGLIVLEFDNEKRYHEFAAAFPHLLKTFTVTSGGRGLPHLYYRVDYPVRNREGAWGSLRSDGRYVVAAPSIINGKQYTVSKNSDVRYLAQDELKGIASFLTPEPVELAAAASPQGRKNSAPPHTGTQNEIITQYEREAPAIGRNNALYRAALTAKSKGMTIEKCASALVEIHTRTQPFWKHENESETQRRREALLTISSAYNLKPTKLTGVESLKLERANASQGISNYLREALLKTDQSSITARLLDVLSKHKMLDKELIINSTELIEIGRQAGLAHHSIRRVLNGEIGIINGVRVAEEIAHSQHLEKPVRYPDKRVINPTKAGGRPPQFYRIAPLVELYDRYNIEDQRSDPLDDNALKSDAAYRKALHHALLKRTPGQYALGWLAHRIGRSIRTIQRYNRGLKIQRIPVFGRTKITWDGLDKAPFYRGKRRPTGTTPGYWLQTGDGEKMPSIRGLAAKLLTRGKRLFACWQMPNFYRVAQTDTPCEPIWRTVGEQQKAPSNAIKSGSVERMNDADKAPIRVPVPYTKREISLPTQDSRGRRLHWNPLKFQPDTEGYGAPSGAHSGARSDARYPVFPSNYRYTLLRWENVEEVLPPDDINEEINEHPSWWKQAALVVKDFYSDGVPKRFPVMRGLAMRLLKEYGEGSVSYVQRESEWALRAAYDEALHAFGCGRIDEGIHLLRRIGLVTYA